MGRTIWTIGHSNRPIEDFVELLEENAVRVVADVRRFPGSRKHPQFGQDALRAELKKAGLGYRHLEDLGGRRSRRRPDSPNTAWRVAAFAAYADYTASAEFETALAELITLAAKRPTVIMCAEALPWRCHRRIIADALVARGWKVLDIFGPGKVEEHELPSFAQVRRRRVTYPGGK